MGLPSRPSKRNQAFSDYLKNERGLMPTSVLRQLPVVRQFLRELCPSGTADLGKLDQEDIIRYVECHASDWSADTGKAMCWALRAFLRYLYFKGLLDRCDRTTAIGPAVSQQLPSTVVSLRRKRHMAPAREWSNGTGEDSRIWRDWFSRPSRRPASA